MRCQLTAQSPQDWKILSNSAPPLADRFRAWARQALARGLPGEDESLRLEWALTLGWKPALTEEVSEPFIRAATLDKLVCWEKRPRKPILAASK